jgi:DNA-3-methyladenine glycosylase I
MVKRCDWGFKDPLMVEYHDTEWGVPQRDDNKIFEALVLDGFQAGLSWLTILRKRESFRSAFDGFDPKKVSKYGKEKMQELLENAGIVRNRMKIEAAIKNAKLFLEIQKEFGSFSDYLWEFVNGKPVQNSWKTIKDIPAKTPLAEEISKDLKNRGFGFVGPTIIYAFMQGIGMINDHTMDCFRHREVQSI